MVPKKNPPLNLSVLLELEKILRERPGSVQAWSALELLRHYRAEPGWEDFPELWGKVEEL